MLQDLEAPWVLGNCPFGAFSTAENGFGSNLVDRCCPCNNHKASRKTEIDTARKKTQVNTSKRIVAGSENTKTCTSNYYSELYLNH